LSRCTMHASASRSTVLPQSPGQALRGGLACTEMAVHPASLQVFGDAAHMKIIKLKRPAMTRSNGCGCTTRHVHPTLANWASRQ
jgi:hypothetical protein